MIGTHNKGNILLVDDARLICHILGNILSEHGYEVRSVGSGKLALEEVSKEVPDLILLDIEMPEMTGYQVCEKLKGNEKFKDIPVIFISGYSNTTDKVKAFSQGGVDYMTKPFQEEELLARVATHLNLRRYYLELQHRNREIHKAFTEVKVVEQELRDNMLDLERFSRLAVDREQHMISLKKEVNQLLVELHREKKYNILE